MLTDLSARADAEAEFDPSLILCCFAVLRGVGVPQALSVACCNHKQTLHRCLIQQDTSVPSPSACCAPPSAGAAISFRLLGC